MISLMLFATTTAASILLTLVMLAFRRHAMSTEDTALADLVAGVFWLAASLLLRGAWWDGVQSLMGRDAFRAFYGGGTWPNVVFHAMVIVAAWRLLRGFWLMIPDEERGQYNFLTAAFYPHRFWARIVRGKE